MRCSDRAAAELAARQEIRAAERVARIEIRHPFDGTWQPLSEITGPTGTDVLTAVALVEHGAEVAGLTVRVAWVHA